MIKMIFFFLCQILEDWCYERAFQVLAAPVKQAQQLGLHFNSQVSFFFFLIDPPSPIPWCLPLHAREFKVCGGISGNNFHG